MNMFHTRILFTLLAPVLVTGLRGCHPLTPRGFDVSLTASRILQFSHYLYHHVGSFLIVYCVALSTVHVSRLVRFQFRFL